MHIADTLIPAEVTGSIFTPIVDDDKLAVFPVLALEVAHRLRNEVSAIAGWHYAANQGLGGFHLYSYFSSEIELLVG